MTVDWTLLNNSFSIKLQNLLNICEKEGIIMKPYSGFRSLTDQAKIWRQSRSTTEVNDEINKLNTNGAPYLASVIQNVGPQKMGPELTNAIPGYCWHNYGQAMDCYLEENGQANWNGEAQGYKVYGQLAAESGLKWGGDFGDWDHVQLNQKEVPDILTLKQVNDSFGK